jgi:hypothetical protein
MEILNICTEIVAFHHFVVCLLNICSSYVVKYLLCWYISLDVLIHFLGNFTVNSWFSFMLYWNENLECLVQNLAPFLILCMYK